MEKEEKKVECHFNGSIMYVPVRIFMETVFAMEVGQKLYVRYDTGAKLFDVSRNQFMKVAKQAEAVHKLDGTTWVNPKEVSRYIESLDA